MKKHILTSLTLLSLTFNTFSWDSSFGYAGRDGSDGYSGSNGRDGASIVILSDGTEQSYDLRGTNGTAGGDAEEGSPASSCYQSQPHNNVYGARGGNGGDGGNGGSGGDGGNVVVRFDDINTLKNIFINSTPGLASYAGRGAEGAPGCRCSNYNWTHLEYRTAYRTVYRRECHNERRCSATTLALSVEKDRGGPGGGGRGPGGGGHGPRPGGPGGGHGPGPGPGPGGPICRDFPVCRDVPYQEAYQQAYYETYYCRDGASGSYGSNGRNGVNGSLGSITLINQLKPLDPVLPSTRTTFANLEAGLVLSDYIWKTQSGARSLFKSGSIISDTFTAYAGRVDQPIKLEWGVLYRPLSDFANEAIDLRLTGTTIGATFLSDDIFFETSRRNEQGVDILTIKNAMKKSEITNVKVTQMYGEGSDTYLEIKDLGGFAEVLKTKFYISADWDTTSSHSDYNQFVEDQYIVREGNTYKILLGKIPLRKNYFKEGKKVELDLTLVRTISDKTVKVGRFGIEKKDLGSDRPLEIEMKSIEI